jgi:hypothetical protein
MPCSNCALSGHNVRTCEVSIHGNRRCFRCGEVKPMSKFMPDKRRAGGRSRLCRKCKKLRDRTTRAIRKMFAGGTENG